MENATPLRRFLTRLTVSSIGTLFLILLVYYSHTPWVCPLFASIVAAITAASLWEYYHIAKVKGYRPLTMTGIIGGIAYCLALYTSLLSPLSTSLPFVVLWITFLLSFLFFFFRGSDPHPMGNLAITIFGLIYLALPLGCALTINFYFLDAPIQDGRLWLIYVLAVSKMTDIAAYFTGKTIGKHPLAPHLSPNKTIEGALGGMLFSIAASIAFPHFFSSTQFYLPLSHSIGMGIFIGIMAQVGDLAESLLKRDAGVKDSNTLPGLGGMLDIVDSVIFTLPLVYFYLHLNFHVLS